MKVSGLYALAINAALLVILRLVKKWIRPGFFTYLLDKKRMDWAYLWEPGHE
jgi:hypothetical protein